MPVTERKPSFTQEEYAQARTVNILDYLCQNGYALEKSGREFQLKIHDSLKINPNGEWFWHSRQTGGKSPIALLQELENIGAVEAVKRLCGKSYEVSEVFLPEKEKLSKTFKLPPRNKNCNRVFAYLNITRCIDAEIISHYMKQHKIYESTDFHNAVFVAADKDGVFRYATVRGTSTYGKPFRRDIEGSDKSYPFALEGKNHRLYIFESCVDALSHSTLFKMYDKDWQADHRISLNGMSNASLPRYLADNPNITDIIFCLDNDYSATFADGRPAPNWGQVRAAKLYDEYSALGYNCTIEIPQHKDVNEDLVSLVKQLDEDELNYEEDYGEEIG